MCGIAGAAWTSDGESLDGEALRRMTDVLSHRGPDDQGHYLDANATGGVALGHRRLSIIDLAGGHQPLSNEDGTVWIVFNGEIYNYRELRPELEAQGHRFQTSTDTETIIHLYEQYGPKCVERLRGMFAFAIWDAGKQRLFLARDRIGQKPLFYRAEHGRISFGSELKALLQVPDAPRQLDPQAVDLFLTYQYVPHPWCILKGYSKLSPGHYAIWQNGSLHTERYWSPPYDDDFDPQSLADPRLNDSSAWTETQWRERLRETLTEAVRLRMRSDVPIGAFLSGGIDSTITAGLMQSLAESPIHTFSIGFPIPEFDERSYARQAAEHLHTNHHEYVVEPSALETLPRLIWHYDEPFGDSSAIPTMYLSEVTRQEVTVALSGDGGDELFAGYHRYQAVRAAGLLDRLPGIVRASFGWQGWQKFPEGAGHRSTTRRFKRFMTAMSRPPEVRYLRWIGMFNTPEMRRQLYSPAYREQVGDFDSAEFLLNAYNHCRGRDFVTRTTCVDVLSYLPCDIMTKVDIASMAFGLEARSPFLDHHVAELAARMPLSLKMSGTRSKKILTDTFSDLIPESIQTRSKMGFGIPIDHWFRNELKELLCDTLLGETATQRGFFDPEYVRDMVESHVSGRVNECYRLWNLLIFEQWCQAFLDRTPAGATTG
ncbi:asparagine synthase (glutamine-hydrolyzing) [Maioricimonas sp. JC845]|uniref:asparagine synthase (glutamine-hydrolyzing) n=1 Tax=Maioricimonas sp. JC845 TaxID=3232138 RepID=UPI00345759EA